jgi:hypothetical protein
VCSLYDVPQFAATGESCGQRFEPSRAVLFVAKQPHVSMPFITSDQLQDERHVIRKTFKAVEEVPAGVRNDAAQSMSPVKDGRVPDERHDGDHPKGLTGSADVCDSAKAHVGRDFGWPADASL